MFSNPEKILIQFGVSPDSVVADFGTGSGFYAFLLSNKVGTKGKVFAVDVSKDMVRKISREVERRHINNLEVIWGDLESKSGSGLKPKSVDSVIVANTLFTISHKKIFVAEIKRVLRKKGRVLLVEWADSFAGMGPHRDHIIDREDAKKLFEDEGLVFDRYIEDAGEHHYGMVFRS